jgi:hypothetical protein
MDPYEIPFVEALDDDFGKLSIDSIVGAPQFFLVTTSTMDRTLLKVVHTILGELLVIFIEITTGR